MYSLEDFLGQQQGNQAVDEISQQVGAQPSLVNSAIQMALPIIISQMANNVSTPQGAESLNNALERDHTNDGILSNLGSLGSMIFGGGQQQSVPKQADAGGILGHIFGNNQGQVTQQVSQQTGLGMGQVAQIFMFLAPMVMSYLGKQKQEQNLGASDLQNILGQQQQQIQQLPQGSFIERMLDQDGDGSSMDDIASMAFKYMTNR